MKYLTYTELKGVEKMSNKEDNLIAKRVMRWKQVERSLRNSEGHYDTVCWDKGHVEVEAFKPTINLSQAWKVIEKLDEEYKEVEIHIENGKYNVLITELFSDGKMKAVHQAYEYSCPLAICRAALKAKGADI